MKNLLCGAILFLFSSFSLADKYGVDESIGDAQSLPGWLLPVLFIGFLIYHFKAISELQNEKISIASKKDGQILKIFDELEKEKKEKEVALQRSRQLEIEMRQVLLEVAHGKLKNYSQRQELKVLKDTLQLYFEGEIYDTDMFDALEPFLLDKTK